MKKFTTTMLLIGCLLTGCMALPSVHADQQAGHVGQQSDISNFDWVLGDWTCVGNYHDVPPFAARMEASYYVFSLVDGALHGSYRPQPIGQTDLPGSDEIWTPRSDGSLGIQLSYTDGSLSTSGAGTSRGGLDDVTLGLALFDGVAGKGTWHHSVTLTPTALSMDSYLGDGTTLNLYLDSSCVPAVP